MELAIFIGIIILFQKGLEKFNIKIRHKEIILGLLGILIVFSAMLGFALFSLRGGKYSSGFNMFFVPIAISMLSVFGFIKSLGSNVKISNKDNTFQTSTKNIIAMGVPLVIMVFADYSFKLPIYKPNIFKLSEPSPVMAVTAYVIFAIILAISMYYVFRVNKESLCKTIALALTGYFVFHTTIYSLALIYGLIERYEVSYTCWGGLLSLSFIPVIGFLVSILQEKDHNIKV